ncbi:Endonuclease, Uma2 family (restriction endonuclease fold) [Cyclobacterium xiamenense]|uniref:Endonuclease, Uma2 family (Restriction endonuclease fold) n=1 Tax=Cyclobacterium xiamenense TaxID=1297121 RepID=A0A1H7C3P9_9BACT|nr:Uma2 family endonuclease [Cyclobacterium xiamenense]SEJ81250.1 Endonuclease, Uma2 family (restriction endonuclease fold) [Cyclobacterium xiamenense]
MIPHEKSDQSEEPFTSYGHYTYLDYLQWQMDEMVELIKGKVFRAAAAPRRIHQELLLEMARIFADHLDQHPCKVFIAPFDVRLPEDSNLPEKIDTVVQPDICVVCDRSKLDERGCLGAPDLVVEILSPGNNQKELKQKYDVYEKSGVKEYWIIHPDEQTLLVYRLINGAYQPSRLLTHGDLVHSQVITGFKLTISDLFESSEGK